MNPSLTIVIPVLNEARILPDRLKALQFVRCRDVELIVVDGGSTDDSLEISGAFCDRALRSPAGRARQMNEGAWHASGEWLLFLHVDTRLEREAFEALLGALAGEPDWGWFDVRIEGEHPLLSLTAAMMNARASLTKVATGDQGLFMKKALFDAVGDSLTCHSWRTLHYRRRYAPLRKARWFAHRLQLMEGGGTKAVGFGPFSECGAYGSPTG